METYFVIMPDGQKYGPADVATLSQWAAENRLYPNSTLENAASGQKMTANTVPGIVWPQAQAAPSAPGSGFASYPRADAYVAAPEGWFDRTYANTSMVVLVLFSLCCGWLSFIMAIIAIATCKNPEAKRRATTSLIISVCLFVFAILLQVVLGGFAGKN